MIDFNGMSSYLEDRQKRKYFIHQNELITDEEISEMATLIEKFSFTEFSFLIEPTPQDQQSSTFHVEAVCLDCHGTEIVVMSRTQLLDYLKVNKNLTKSKKSGFYHAYVCIACKLKKDASNVKLQNEYQEATMRNTENFIMSYLNPNRFWNKGIKFYERWREITYTNVDWQKIEYFIQSMNYRDFLETPYWTIVSEKKKIQAKFKCQLCNSQSNLQTHHRTYSIRGKELQNLNDLVVLCEECHKKHHDIEEQKREQNGV